MACSAVVIELPNGVFITMTPRAVAAGMSTLSTPMPARPTTFSFVALFEQLGRDLGGRADREAVVLADDLGEFVLVEAGLDVDLDAALLEDRDGGGGELVGDENAGSHGDVLSRSLLPLAGEGGAKRRMRGRRRGAAEAFGTATQRRARDAFSRRREKASHAALASLAFSSAKA